MFRWFNKCYTTLLNKNYRSHPKLLTVPNSLFYGNALEPCADEMKVNMFNNFSGLTAEARAIKGGFPFVFHGVEGQDLREGNSPSWFNPMEAALTVDYINEVLKHKGGGVKAENIGVITPYHKQVLKIKELLRKKGLAEVQVGSVEIFQGGEKEVIILSTVRSSVEHIPFDTKHALGFLSNPKRFNVAVTRAKCLLVVIGNPFILKRDENWKALLKYALDNKAYKGCEFGFEEGAAQGPGEEEDAEMIVVRRVVEEEEAIQKVLRLRNSRINWERKEEEETTKTKTGNSEEGVEDFGNCLHGATSRTEGRTESWEEREEM